MSYNKKGKLKVKGTKDVQKLHFCQTNDLLGWTNKLQRIEKSS